MISWYHDIMISWYHDIMVPWAQGPGSHGAHVFRYGPGSHGAQGAQTSKKQKWKNDWYPYFPSSFYGLMPHITFLTVFGDFKTLKHFFRYGPKAPGPMGPMFSVMGLGPMGPKGPKPQKSKNPKIQKSKNLKINFQFLGPRPHGAHGAHYFWYYFLDLGLFLITIWYKILAIA